MSISERLDNLISTTDIAFNGAAQSVIIQHTQKGHIYPNEYAVEYLEKLREVFFFCLKNHARPFVCLEYIAEFAEDDYYLLHLVDSVLHLISQSDNAEGMSTLTMQLLNIRHEIAPWDEDETVKAVMAEMEKVEIENSDQQLDSNHIIINSDEPLKFKDEGDTPKLGFETYINECHRAKLIPYLVEYYEGQKPKQFGYMLYALQTLDIITNVSLTANQTQLHEALSATFGNVGTRQRLQQLIHDLGRASASEEINIRRHVDHIKSFLETHKSE